MNNELNKYFKIGILSLVVMSCATPQVAEIKKAKEIPTNTFSETDVKLDLNQQVELRTYFNDPELLNLFDEVVKANPDFQIAQQRIEIANSFLQRSKMSFLPSLEVGAVVSGDHYGKYTMEGVGNYDTNCRETSPKIKKSTEM